MIKIYGDEAINAARDAFEKCTEIDIFGEKFIVSEIYISFGFDARYKQPTSAEIHFSHLVKVKKT